MQRSERDVCCARLSPSSRASLLSATYAAAFFAYGASAGTFAPAIITLAAQMGVSPEVFGVAFMLRGLGSTVGSAAAGAQGAPVAGLALCVALLRWWCGGGVVVVGGWRVLGVRRVARFILPPRCAAAGALMPRVSPHTLTCAALVVFAGVNAVMPWLRSYAVLLTVCMFYAIAGVREREGDRCWRRQAPPPISPVTVREGAGGVLDTVCNTLSMWAHPSSEDKWLLALHIGYGWVRVRCRSICVTPREGPAPFLGHSLLPPS